MLFNTNKWVIGDNTGFLANHLSQVLKVDQKSLNSLRINTEPLKE